MNYSDKLRKFADYLDRHPTLADQLSNRWEHPTAYIMVEGWENFQKVIADLGGYTKSGYGGNLTARHVGTAIGAGDADDETMYRVSVNISGVCTPKPKLDDEGNPVMRPKTKVVDLDEMEPVMEYDCPPVWSE